MGNPLIGGCYIELNHTIFFLTNFSIKFILGQFGENELEKNYSTVVDTYVHSHTCVSEVVDS